LVPKRVLLAANYKDKDTVEATLTGLRRAVIIQNL
jgi:hypothetical protein